MSDLRIENHGSILLLRPQTQEGHDFIQAVLEGNDEAQTFGGALVVEPRYLEGVLVGAVEDFGLEVR